MHGNFKLATLALSLVFMGVGLWGWVQSEDMALRSAAAAALFSSLFGICLARNFLVPTGEPTVRALSRFGPPVEVLANIQVEYDEGHPAWYGRTCLLPNWLVAQRAGTSSPVAVTSTRPL